MRGNFAEWTDFGENASPIFKSSLTLHWIVYQYFLNVLEIEGQL